MTFQPHHAEDLSLKVHASPEVLVGEVRRVAVVDRLQLVVAPGEPDDPQKARAFLLSWWEKDCPPSSRLVYASKRVAGWHFLTKRLGVEGRALVARAAASEEEAAARMHATWVAMFGPIYSVRLRGEDE